MRSTTMRTRLPVAPDSSLAAIQPVTLAVISWVSAGAATRSVRALAAITPASAADATIARRSSTTSWRLRNAP